MQPVAFETFREAFIAGDGDRLAKAFAPDGAYATNAGMLLDGRAQIRAGATEWFRRRPAGAVMELEVTLLRTNETDGLRWELLSYRQHGFVPGQPAAGSLDESGHALAVYRADDTGAWRIESLVVNLRGEGPQASRAAVSSDSASGDSVQGDNAFDHHCRDRTSQHPTGGDPTVLGGPGTSGVGSDSKTRGT